MVEEWGPSWRCSCRFGRRVCASRRQGALREGVRRRDHGVHGRRRSVRGAGLAELVVDTEAARPGRERRLVVEKLEELGLVGACRREGRRRRRPDRPTAVARRRTGERPDGVDGLERVTLTSREVSDLEMLASGALSPLEGSWARTTTRAWSRRCSSRPVSRGPCRSVSRSPMRRAATRSRSRTRTGHCSRPRGRGVVRLRHGARGGAVLPHGRRCASGRRAALRAEAASTWRPRHGVPAPGAGVPLARTDPAETAASSPSAAGGASSASRRGTRSTAPTST